MIIDLLIDQIVKKNNPTVVGLDPRLSYIPKHIQSESFEVYGKTPAAVAHCFLQWGRILIDSLCDIVPAVKPNIAMYEEYGSEGVKAFIDTVSYAKEHGMVVVGDIKRGDIASTAQSYADGHIGNVCIDDLVFNIYDEDFVTLNPYLGIDSISPFLSNCKKYDKGIFVLVKTSNTNSGQLQDLDVGGMTLYEKVGALVSEWGEEFIGKYGYSSVGAVVGATHSSQAKRLRRIMPHSFFLVPGYGAQGATAADLAVCFDNNGLGAIINSSRGIVAAYKNASCPEKDFALAARDAALCMRADLRCVL